MPRGRKKSVSGVGTVKVVLINDPSEEITDVSCGLPPKIKDSRLDLVMATRARANGKVAPQPSPPLRRSPTRQNKMQQQQQSPAKCLRSRITDFFSPSSNGGDAEGPPVLKRFDEDDDEDVQVIDMADGLVPCVDAAPGVLIAAEEDQASDRSEGDSGKENDDQEYHWTRSRGPSAATSRDTSPHSEANNAAPQAVPQSSSKTSLSVSGLVNAQNATGAGTGDSNAASTSAAGASQGGKQRASRQGRRGGRGAAAAAARSANTKAAPEPPARVVTRSRAALSHKPMPQLSLSQPLSVVTSSAAAPSSSASSSAAPSPSLGRARTQQNLSTPPASPSKLRAASPSPMRTPSSSPVKVPSSPMRRVATPCSSPSPVRRTATPSSPPTPHKIKLVESSKTPSTRSSSPVSAAALQKLKISFSAMSPKKTSDESEAPSEVGPSGDATTLLSTTTKAASKATAKGPKKRTPAASATAAAKPTAAGGRGNAAAKLAAAAAGSQKVTDFFPIRRSERKPKKTLEEEHLKDVETHLITDGDEHLPIAVKEFPEKGRGVVAMQDFKRGDFVVEYAGDLINIGIAKERECQYSLDLSTGCYMYYFKHKAKQYCIDATSESGRLGRLVNHSRLTPNLQTKVVELHDKPRLILIARKDISEGEELLYDYGDRSKESMSAHPWLAL